MCVLALADDMTGALEVGAKFSSAGIRTLVSAQPVPSSSAPVLVLDTETRHRSPELAAQEVRRFALESGAVSPRLVYKKTDSTLRGNISAELRALAELYPNWRIGYAPAYPGLGRTVKKGVLYIEGVPVAETEFARDLMNPIRTSSVAEMLEPSLACTIFDGETDEDLTEAARTILSDSRMRIAAGPAGLAGTIAEQIDLPRGSPAPLPAVRSCLVINGSLHEKSSIQMQHAVAEGCIALEYGSAWRTFKGDRQLRTNPAEVANENAQCVLEQIMVGGPDAILVIGGDTAFAVIKTLGLPPLVPIAEVVPGVPFTRVEAAHLAQAVPGRRRDLLLITKAGSFGGPDVLCRVRQRLSNVSR